MISHTSVVPKLLDWPEIKVNDVFKIDHENLRHFVYVKLPQNLLLQYSTITGDTVILNYADLSSPYVYRLYLSSDIIMFKN